MSTSSLLRILLRSATKSEIPLASSSKELFHLSAERAGKELAYLDIEKLPITSTSPSAKPKILLHDAFTDPAARGQGLATKLFTSAEEHFPHSEHWLASTSPEMDSLASKLGFSLEKTRGLRSFPESIPPEISFSNANIFKKTIPAIAPAAIAASGTKMSNFDSSELFVPGLERLNRLVEKVFGGGDVADVDGMGAV